MHEEVQNDAIPLKTIQAKYKNVTATAFGCLNLWWTHGFLLFFFFFFNIFLLPFYQKNKKENVTATYLYGAVLSRLTHMWHYIMKEMGYGIISIPSNAIITNYFTTFLQNVDVANLLLVFI